MRSWESSNHESAKGSAILRRVREALSRRWESLRRAISGPSTEIAPEGREAVRILKYLPFPESFAVLGLLSEFEPTERPLGSPPQETPRIRWSERLGIRLERDGAPRD